MSSFGRLFRFTTAGESHSAAVSIIVEGVPSGIYLSLPHHIQPTVDRRRPGQSDLTTPRSEMDIVDVTSGIEQRPLMYYYDYKGNSSIHAGAGNHHQQQQQLGDKNNSCQGGSGGYPLSAVLVPKPWLKDGEGPNISNIFVSPLPPSSTTAAATQQIALPTAEEIEAIRRFDEEFLLKDRSQGITLGTPLAFSVRNKDTRKQDYNFMTTMSTTASSRQQTSSTSTLPFIPRPSHGDLSYYLKYNGHVASSGGGRSSARETLARVIAGAVAQRVLWWVAHGGRSGGGGTTTEGESNKATNDDVFHLTPLLASSDSTSQKVESNLVGDVNNANATNNVRIPSAFPRVVAYTLGVGGVSATTNIGDTIDGNVITPGVEEEQQQQQPNINKGFTFAPTLAIIDDCLGANMFNVPADASVTNQLLGLSSVTDAVKSAASGGGESTTYFCDENIHNSRSISHPHHPSSFTRLLKHRSSVEVTSRSPPSKDVIQCDAAIREVILNAGKASDSVGGIVRCVVENCPFGLGEPVFDKFEAMLAHAMMSIPASKGFLMGYGTGFASANGSVVNDRYTTLTTTTSSSSSSSPLVTITNYSGGISGGISTGGRVYFDVIFKPPATIGIPQHTCDSNGNPTVLAASGRHDPCVVPRAVPVVEAMASAVILDCLMLRSMADSSIF